MTTNRCRAQHPASNHERGARIVECGLNAGHTGWHVEADTAVSWPPIVPVDQASTEPATPPPPAPVPTELTAEQMIHLTALDRAIAFAQYRDGLEDPAGWALATAARFEAYIRDGAK